MSAGMPLRVCDFHSCVRPKNKLSHAFDAEGGNEGVERVGGWEGDENADPNAGERVTKMAGEIKAKLQPLTPARTGDFTDDYWGVGGSHKKERESRTVSPTKEDVDIRRIYKKLVVANGGGMKSPRRGRTKSPMRLKKSAKKKNAKKRKAALKEAMLLEGKERQQLAGGDVREEVVRRVMEWRGRGGQVWERGVEEGKVWFGEGKTWAEERVGVLAQDLQGAKKIFVGGAGVMVALVVAVGLALLVGGGVVDVEQQRSLVGEVGEVGEVAMTMTEDVSLPEALLEPVGEILPFDIASVEIQGSSTLNWKVEGDVLGHEDLSSVFVSVFVDGESKYFGSVRPDAGSNLLDMSVDLMPLEEGMHSFLLTVTSNSKVPFSRHVSANFIYELGEAGSEVRDTIKLDILSPSMGERIKYEDFKGIVFDSFGVPDDALEKGGYVNLVLDNERFNIPFFEGEINLEGLGVGLHEVKMGFVLDLEVKDEVGVEFEIY
ncbi:hypothetical protein TL16_g00650 [Triparma laevis f. inornata]|uniref:Uncharacterized protein n=1 Tax=Triparma laevis f. inornata TaxID=1714386 RepID=A0A9W6ZF30_9STRA|nr:hypothetical protein TL16_g00650 [Triparma laevis f. inornata]